MTVHEDLAPEPTAPTTDQREDDRLRSLHSYGILDTAPETHYDELVRAAAKLCGAVGAVIGFVDRDRTWMKASTGLSRREFPRRHSMSAAVVDLGAPLIVADLSTDPRFRENLSVGSPDLVRAYAGVPIVGLDGLPLGAIGVYDRRPREFAMADIGALKALAELTVALLELHRRNGNLYRARAPDGLDLRPVRLREAIDTGEMQPFFQPVVDLRTGALRGLESLVRWRHPVLGTLPPGRFLPTLEDTDLVSPLGRHMLHSSLRLLHAWRSRLPDAEGWVLSVNVSPGQLTTPGLTDMVVAALIENRVPSHLLELEITEDRSFLDDATAHEELSALHRAGVRLALDDYGTGHSSLQRLLDLPLSTVKLDRSLVQRLPHDPRTAAALRSTLTLTTDLGLEVIAEGVETPDQLKWLTDHGVPLAQGFLLSRPVPSQAVPHTARTLPRAALASRTATEPGRAGPDRAGPEHGHSHEIVKTSDPGETIRGVCDFVRSGLVRPVTADDPYPGASVVIATPTHWHDLERSLVDAGVDVPGHLATGRLTVLDADETLPQLLQGGPACVDGTALRQLFIPSLRTTHEAWGHIAAYGEMTALLWERGDVVAALDLENEWNSLTDESTFSVCCRYPQEDRRPCAVQTQWDELDSLHTAIISA